MTGEQQIHEMLAKGLTVREALMERAVLDLGPYVPYPDGTVCDRRTGAVLWRPGDPGAPPKNPERGKSNKPHTKRHF